jgi:hypothetical protein
MSSQSAQADGRNNIIVQVVGDGNTVEFGHAYLTLIRYLKHRTITSDTHEIGRLNPYAKALPLIGRGAEMAALWRWLDDPRPVSLRMITGRAGSGKTRIALEMIEQAIARRWDAGFAEPDELVRFRTQQNLAGWGWRRPTLVVVDQAAAQALLLKGWLAELADHPGDPSRPLRLLLLERHANPEGGWCQGAFGGWEAEALARPLDPDRPVALPALADAADGAPSSTACCNKPPPRCGRQRLGPIRLSTAG